VDKPLLLALCILIMNTEPKIDNSKLWASSKGALASTSVILVMLVLAFLIPSDPGDDGYIRSAAILIGALPIALVFFLLYFLFLSNKEGRPLKFALICQSVCIVPLSVFVFYAAYSDAGMLIGLVNFSYTFIFLSMPFGIGAWVWSKPINT
jgi:hypothetical protein